MTDKIVPSVLYIYNISVFLLHVGNRMNNQKGEVVLMLLNPA